MVDLVRLDELRAMLKVYGLDVVIDYDPEAKGGQFTTIRTRFAMFDKTDGKSHPFTVHVKTMRDDDGRPVNQYFNLNSMEQVEMVVRTVIRIATDDRNKRNTCEA